MTYLKGWIPTILRWWMILLAGQAIADTLRGPAFSDPARLMEMPAQWQTQPIDRGGAPKNTDLIVTLDQHLYPALLPLIREYAKNQELEINVQEGTCGISAGMLVDKQADIGGFCCPPGETDRLPGLAFHTVGIAALALLVHPDNPLSNLDLATAQQVFQGSVRSWKSLAGDHAGFKPDTAIRPIGRLHCKARPGHWRLILDNEDMFSPLLQETSTIPDMISGVARYPGAIGYETLWNTERFPDSEVKALHVNGHNPRDQEALVIGAYPLYRVYNITTWTAPPARTPEADALVDYLLKNAHRIDPKYAIVPAQRLRAAGWQFVGNELTGPLGDDGSER